MTWLAHVDTGLWSFNTAADGHVMLALTHSRSHHGSHSAAAAAAAIAGHRHHSTQEETCSYPKNPTSQPIFEGRESCFKESDTLTTTAVSIAVV